MGRCAGSPGSPTVGARRLGLGGLLAAVAGCASFERPTVRLGPDPGEAAAEVTPVAVVALDRAWDGPIRLPSSVTPLAVGLRNHGDRSVRIDPDRIGLRSPDRQVSWRVLEPEQLVRRGALPAEAATLAWGDPIWWSGWGSIYRPYLFGACPGACGWSRGGAWGPYGFGATDWQGHPVASRWWRTRPWQPSVWGTSLDWMARSPASRRDATSWLLPRVLHPGDEVTGWLFFERVHPDARQVILTMEFVDASGDGGVIASTRVPLHVELETR